MVGKSSDEEKWWREKAVIDALRRKPMSAMEVAENTPVRSRSTVYHILSKLTALGLLERDEEVGRWMWYEYAKTYRSKLDRDACQKHSEDLAWGLKAILWEGGDMGADLWRKDKDEFDRKAEAMKPLTEEHLISGHSKIYESVEEFRGRMEGLKSKLREAKEKISALEARKSSGFEQREIGLIHHLPVELPHVMEERWVQEIKDCFDILLHIFRTFDMLALEIKWGNPLSGRCEHCPRIYVDAQPRLAEK